MPSDSSVTGATARYCGVAGEGLGRPSAGMTGENSAKLERGTVHPVQSLRKEARVGAGPRQGREVLRVQTQQQHCLRGGGAVPTH